MARIFRLRRPRFAPAGHERERRDLETVIAETGGVLALPLQRHAGQNLVAQGNPHFFKNSASRMASGEPPDLAAGRASRI